MKINQLEITNIGGITHIKVIIPSKGIEFAGKNGACKTTILSVPRWLMMGANAINEMPLKKGKTEGGAQMIMGDYIVTLKLHENKKAKWDIRLKDGGKYGQKKLKEFFGQFTFDPRAFSGLSMDEKRKILEEFAGDEWCAVMKALRKDLKKLEDDRLTQGRLVTKMGVPEPVEEVESVNIDLLRKKEDAIIAFNNKQDDLIAEIAHKETAVDNCEQWVNDIDKQIAETETTLKKLRKKSTEMQEQHALAVQTLKQLGTPEEFKPTDAIAEAIDEAEETNLKAAQYKQSLVEVERYQKEKAEYEQYGQQIKDKRIEIKKHSSEIKLPVDGLELTEDNIMFNGTPLAQEGKGDRLITSAEIGMAMNPKLEVMFVEDAEGLDDDNFEALLQLADRKGYQVWLASVGKGRSGDAIQIEAGAIKEQ
jgi:hypothetical protein